MLNGVLNILFSRPLKSFKGAKESSSMNLAVEEKRINFEGEHFLNCNLNSYEMMA